MSGMIIVIMKKRILLPKPTPLLRRRKIRIKTSLRNSEIFYQRSKLYHNNKKKLITITTIIVATIAVILVIFGKYLIHMLFGVDFEPAYYPMLILVGGQLINCVAGSVGMVLNMTGHEVQALRGSTLCGLFNIVACALLIPRWGAMGAATASAASLVLWNLLMLYLVKRTVGMRCSLIGVWLR